MTPHIPGLHHVTAITANGQKNIDFYTGVLGLRLIKVTVNFDDPASYHLYYGDQSGAPGSAMTFFVWEGGRAGRVGAPQAVMTQFAVPPGSLPYWVARFEEQRVPHQPLTERWGDSVLAFSDPDDMPLELVETTPAAAFVPATGPVPPDYAIRGFFGVTLASADAERTGALLANIMGLSPLVDTDGDRIRYQGRAAGAAVVDVLQLGGTPRGYNGTGTIHHVAFRVPDDDTQKGWQSLLQERGFGVSPVMDRCYFHSIYFREPGGILFEFATDGPGFTTDESLEALGARLQLPPWMEENRAQIETSLAPLRWPTHGSDNPPT